MDCPKCGYAKVPETARCCPKCGEEFEEVPEPSAQISVTQEVGTVEDGEVTGVHVGEVEGDVTIDSTVNQIEARIVEGDYVDRQTITNNILVLGPKALEEIVKGLAARQGVDKQVLQTPGARAVPEHVNRQIEEVVAAQKEVAAKGMAVTPQAAYQLGMLAAYRRHYDEALAYFRLAAQADPEFSDAFEAIAWLQQSLAMDDIQNRDYEKAIDKLADARTAALRTDPLDPNALAQRGYIEKTLAQIAEARGNQEERQQHYTEAARIFEHVVRLEPDNAGAHNGLGNIHHALGNLDAAVAAYERAIELVPYYTAAFHDLAYAYEGKMEADPDHAAEWCRKALENWREAYRLAPDDPGFSSDTILLIGRRILWLEQQCGQYK